MRVQGMAKGAQQGQGPPSRPGRKERGGLRAESDGVHYPRSCVTGSLPAPLPPPQPPLGAAFPSGRYPRARPQGFMGMQL